MHKPLSIAVLVTTVVLAPTVALAEGSSSYPSSAEQIQPAAVSDPQEFTTKAAGAGAFEIQSSQLALSKTQNADIKAFAQMMIDDHTNAAAVLQTAATAQGKLTVPAYLDADSAAKLQKLQAAGTADFDPLYVQMQTDAHVDAVALFSGFAQNGPSGPLRDFAAQTLPTLRMHYQHALSLPH